MIRSIKSLVVLAAMGMAIPSLASALGISIVNVSGPGASGTLLPGETITFDLVLENDTNEQVLGLGAFVDGYDTPDIHGIYDGGLVLQGGQVAASVLDAVIPSVGTFVTLESVHAGPFETFEVNNLVPVAWTTTVFQAVSLSGSNQDGQLDTGIGGNPVLGGTGDVHFRLTYVAIPAGIETQRFTMNFGLDGVGPGGIALATTGDSFYLTVIPEPGTALLMGLGLAGLASRRR